MSGAAGIAAVILIFLEEAQGEWVAVADLARLLALDTARVADELRAIPAYAPSEALELQEDGAGRVTAARLANNAAEAA